MALKRSCGVILCLIITIFGTQFSVLLDGTMQFFLQLTSFNDGVATCTPKFEHENCASLHALL